MRVITISGLDGSGKSTQVDRLRTRFEGEGLRVEYFHAVHFSVARFPSRLLGRSPSDGDGAVRAGVTRSGRTGVLLREAMLRVDLVRYRLLLRRLRRRGIDVLISDRFYYDNLVNIAYLKGSTRFVSSTPPRPDIAIYLRAEPAAIMARDRPPEQGIDYLEAKRGLYDAISERFGLTVVDGSRDPEAVARSIARLL